MQAIRDLGPFDGMCGFSQVPGWLAAAAAAMVSLFAGAAISLFAGAAVSPCSRGEAAAFVARGFFAFALKA